MKRERLDVCDESELRQRCLAKTVSLMIKAKKIFTIKLVQLTVNELTLFLKTKMKKVPKKKADLIHAVELYFAEN